MSVSWKAVAGELRRMVSTDALRPVKQRVFDEGQRASLSWIARQLPDHGLVLADEVGTGKTRIACAIVQAVLAAGGRAAVVVPRGLMQQWAEEAGKLDPASKPPKRLTTLTGFLDDARGGRRDDLYPRRRTAEWWLLSHGFKAPDVRTNSRAWRVALPGLVALRLATARRRPDGRSRAGRLLAQLEAETAGARWQVLWRIAGDVAPRARKSRSLRKELARLPALGRDGSNNDVLRNGHADEVAAFTERLLGLWLGNFDLLVVDEAHKSRGAIDEADRDDEAADATVLTRLLDQLLHQPATGRRLCVTATPMELELSQWIDLLRRARCGVDEKAGQAVLGELDRAAKAAASAPDEVPRLEALCVAAEKFSAWLAPYVTRRRRSDDPLLRRFRAAAVSRGCDAQLLAAHPHRCRKSVAIAWADATGEEASPWIDVLLSAEAMSHAARGLPNAVTKEWPRAIRDAYTKLSAGHVSVDLSDDALALDASTVSDIQARDKVARTAYWLRRLTEARGALAVRAGADGACDCEHPRILAAAREIEAWTSRREKVLVFGVFLGPLHLLRDVLEVRHALRAVDGRRPVSTAIHKDPTLLAIAGCHLAALHREGALRGELVGAGVSDLRTLLARGHREHKNNQNAVRKLARRHVDGWFRDPRIFGGEHATPEQHRIVEDHLVSFAIDRLLAEGRPIAQTRAGRIATIAQEYLGRSLRPVLDEASRDDEAQGNEENLRLDRVLRALHDPEGRHAPFAALMHGGTEHERRHYLKTAFNRGGASPFILLAQSQVGREGLNLHESCRVIVQFHAEWNPAVLEQQIGRVDRKKSRWEHLARTWLDAGARGVPDRIEVRQLVFEGTYDAYQWDRVARRRHAFDASLFGTLLPEDAWSRVPEDRVDDLRRAAPDFSPPPARGRRLGRRAKP